MKELKTIRGETMLVDDQDYEKAKQYKWMINSSTGKSHVITWLKDANKPVSYKNLILGLGSKFTLYKNDNHLDLRRENIRVFDTRSECFSAIAKTYSKKTRFNIKQSIDRQRRARTSNPSGYIGIVYVGAYPLHPWISTLVHNQTHYYMGNYKSSKHAALAYDQKAIEIYGLESKRNFPNLTLEELTKRVSEIKADNRLFSSEVIPRNRQGKLMIFKTIEKNFPIPWCFLPQKEKNR